MPRKSRIDAPGAVHHIIARGIERREIFKDNDDQKNFLERINMVISATETTCFAWALIPNHFHLVLKTGRVPIATVMRKLLTGYAVSFNKKHKRSGHLFQNRYKSILCQENTYLLELIRYIHLNPLRAKLVKSYDELGNYPFCGHAVIKGKIDHQWQDSEYVLSLFADTQSLARRRYGYYVKEGISEEKRSDLTGGGLIRSCGGWNEVKRMRKNQEFQKSDERILGDGDFVEEVLAHVGEQIGQKNKYNKKSITYKKIAKAVAKEFDLKPNQLFTKSKKRCIVKARNVFIYLSVSELGVSMTELSTLLDVTVSAVSQANNKGETICLEENYSLQSVLKL